MRNYRLIWSLVFAAAVLLSAGQTAMAAPSNDLCANALPIGNVTNQPFDTTGATHDGLYSNGNDIWYCYTATCTGTATISLCGTTWDSMLAVYSGCQCPATVGRRLAYNDDYCGLASQVSIPVTGGNQYLIEVGHWYTFSSGTGVISVSCVGTPVTTNDNCANAQTVGNVTNLAFTTVGATHDGPSACIMNSPNIWYKYTATCTGTAVFSLCGSSFDTVLAVYSGTSCSNLSLVGCNDDACGSQSELSISVTSGKTYWIEVGGLSQTDVGTGKLTISCGGQVQDASDLGDAPDTTNHTASIMRTYDNSVTAQFPTVFTGNAVKGPIHLDPKGVAYLGNTVTFEDEADQGYDQDPTNNILPTQLNINADRDLGDDGVVMSTDPWLGSTLAMNHCQFTTFNYKVNVIDPNVDMWVNVWFDWNRDGDWEDDGNTDQNLNCASCNTGGAVKEWAVQNQLLYNLNTGINTITTPGFLAWHPASGNKKIWMRITLSDQPWKGGTGAAGSGPTNGYDYGETEDYYFTPNEDCVVCEDLNRDGVVDEYDLFTYMMLWLNNCSE
ncbi:MAG: hypothetical protein JW787_09400 [Sedimentisphaerales bacterium]|nr:hypothetical protein [Sedimentisphaerales bacterium]